jgi:hypothetical protein
MTFRRATVPTMSQRTTRWIRVAGATWCLLSISACAGQPKPAAAPSACPEGTVLQGSDCLPSAPASEATTANAPVPSVETSAAPPSDAQGPSSPGSAGSGEVVPYDKDAVEAELKRGARQVRANCGAATDDEGQATGPWGVTEASIMLGRNGHVRQVTVPPPYDGKPVGVCIIHSFDRIEFPPYAASSDAVVAWKVELVKPKH